MAPDVDLAGGPAFLAWYTAPGPHAPWRFADGGNVLAWSDGGTLAFTEQLYRCVQRVTRQLQVLPPFAAYAILAAAARHRDELPADRTELLRRALEASLPDASAKQDALARLADLQATLSVLRGVPAAFWQRYDALDALAEAVLEKTGLAPDGVAAELLLEGLAQAPLLDRPQTRRGGAMDDGARLADAVAILQRGLAALDPRALERRARTGLEQELRPAALDELRACERVKQLVAELHRDPEHGALARLAHDLMAALRLPRSLLHPDELPLGGVGDVGNRGPLDRLLPSELAHDDLTLAVRVALNEALYLRREAPPRTEGGTRAILLDSGIRLWGVARLFATAVGVACAGTAERRGTVRAFRAAGSAVDEVDLGSRDGLLTHLSTLLPTAHPGAAVTAFLAAVPGGVGDVERIVVTHRAALDDASFAPALAALGGAGAHVVAVDADGRLGLHALSRRGRVLVREARLRLDDLLARPARAGPSGTVIAPALRDAGGPLPAISRADPFPLLLPHRRRGQWCGAGEHGLVAVTHDRRVMLWTESGRGARQLVDRLPGRTLGVDVRDGRAIVVCRAARAGLDWCSWIEVPLEDGPVRTFEMPPSRFGAPRAIVFLPETAVAIHEPVLECIARSDTAAWTPRLELPAGARWSAGRFFQRGDDWYALAFDGTELRLELVPLGSGLGGCVGLFDRAGHDGPWALLRTGEAVSTASGEHVRLERTSPVKKVVAVSHDGNRLRLHDGSLVDLSDASSLCRYLEPLEACVYAPPWVVKNFRGVAEHGGRLALVRNDGAVRVVEPDWRNDCLRLGYHQRVPVRRECAFAPRPRDGGWSLRAADLGGGGLAWLDSRGMLHLRSSDASVAEVTLVLLQDHPLAGWASDGTLHGPAYCVGDAPTVGARAFDERIRAIVEGWRE